MDLLFTFVGFIFGMIVTAIIFVMDGKTHKNMISGKLKIDFSNVDNHLCELEICEDINSIYSKKYITLLVETKDFSQE